MLFIFDIDDTICFDGVSIDISITNALENITNNGHQIAFASARPIRDLLPVVNPISEDTLLIGGNGSIVRQEGNIKIINPIPSRSYKIIKQLIEQYQLNYIIDDTFNYSAVLPQNNSIADKLDPAHLASNVSISEIQAPIKVILLDMEPQTYKLVLSRLKKFDNELSLINHTKENNIDITSKGINKFTTLRKITDASYIAFGNDNNDVELLNNAQDSYFVGNKEQAELLNLKRFHVINKNPNSIATVINSLL